MSTPLSCATRRSTSALFLLGAIVATAFLLSSCSDDDPVGPQRYEHADTEDRVLLLINDYRQSLGLAPLSLSDAIVQEARGHSQSMAGGTTAFGHDGFNDRVLRLGKVIAVAGAGENVAWNQGFSDPAKTAFDAWLKSPGHKANIEGQWNLTGIGIAKGKDNAYYFTQIFVKTK